MKPIQSDEFGLFMRDQFAIARTHDSKIERAQQEFMDYYNQPRNISLIGEFNGEAKEYVMRQLTLRRNLITEEFMETMDAMAEIEGDLRYDGITTREAIVSLLDGLADLMYVVAGTAVAFNMSIDEAYARVHVSNMSKLDEHGQPIYSDTGKVLKGPHFQPPELGDLV